MRCKDNEKEASFSGQVSLFDWNKCSIKIYYFLNNGKEGLDVPDPWFGELEGFFPVFELIDKAAERILEEIEEEVKGY